MIRLPLAACLFAALSAVQPPPAPSPSDRPLATIGSRHYRVKTDLDRREAEPIVRHMDRVYEEYQRRFADFPVHSRRGFDLYLFTHSARYQEHVRSHGYDASGTVGVFYVSNSGQGLATCLEGQGREMLYTTLQHEGFHQFAWARISPDLPVWVNEGLAEYFGDACVVRSRFVLGGAEESRLERVRSAIEKRRTDPLDVIATMTDQEWDRRVTGPDGRMLYDQAWSFVHFLIEAENGKYADRFVDYLRGYAAGLPPYPTLASALRVSDYEALEAEWKQHVTALQPDPVISATTRLSFLARGLRSLHEAGTTPATMDELRDKLRETNFEARRPTHAGVTVLSARDDRMFVLPRPAGEAAGNTVGTWEVRPSRTPTMPPTLRGKVGETTLSVRWLRTAAGALRYEIEYE